MQSVSFKIARGFSENEQIIDELILFLTKFAHLT